MNAVPTRDEYISANECRENIAIERILLGMLESNQWWTEPLLHWAGEFSWFAIGIPTKLLLPPGVDEPRRPGDVDIMGGPLTVDAAALRAQIEIERGERPGANPTVWRHFASLECVADGQTVWPPPLSLIGAAEIKSSSLDSDLNRRPVRERRREHAYKQAEGLAAMGFDRAAIIWIAATEPVVLRDGMGGSPWMDAAARACHAGRDSERCVTAHEQPYGQIALSVAAVPGGLENVRGAIDVNILRQPPILARKPGSAPEAVRRRVEEFMHDVFERFELPRSFPVVVRACPPGGCGNVFVANPPASRVCPSCGR